MTMLKLREGWTAITPGATTYIYAPGESTNSTRWYVDMDSDEVAAYPHGERQAQVFDTVEEAHAYLIESGSESPWEVVSMTSPRSEQIREKAKAKLQRAAATRDLLPAPPIETYHYELHIDTNNAALTRFATALLTTPCTLSPRKLRLSGELGRGITQMLMVSFPDVDSAERFRERCKPQDMFRAKVATPGGGMRVARPTKGDE